MDQQDRHGLADPVVQSLNTSGPLNTGPARNVAPVMSASEARQFRSALLDMTDRLIFDLDWVPAGRVIATIVACRSELVRVGARGDGLLAATEACVRRRIDSPSPARGPVSGAGAIPLKFSGRAPAW